MPYVALVKILQARIINVLMRTYNMSPSEAYDIWSKALVNYDERIGEILNTIIKNENGGEGIAAILNRNP